MAIRYYFSYFLCLVALFIVASVQAQDVSSLDNVQTPEDITTYVQQERSKRIPNTSPKENALRLSDVCMRASTKLWQIAKNDAEMEKACVLMFDALQYQITAEVEGAEQQMEVFFNELAAHVNPGIRNLTIPLRFRQYSERAMKATASPEFFGQFTSELKMWINYQDISIFDIASLGIEIAGRNRVAADNIIAELVEYVQTPECTLRASEKKKAISLLEGTLRLTVGSDPRLYGKTLEGSSFKWEDLRGKYILINFTATWCGPCRREIPGMLEAYEKYHDKGLEIVSVYFRERGSELTQVGTVKKFVEEQKLPWSIISEAMTAKAGQPKQSEFYGMRGVPTMVLVDKEGKIIMQEARGSRLQAKLAEIFK